MAQGYIDALSWVPKSRNLAASLARAYDYAKAQGHASVTLEHLLLALLSDPDASLVLHASNVDLGRLNADLSTYLAGKQERKAAAPAADPTAGEGLLRIVEYASAAAQQSRRREINGAIVLAAVVGDGRSAAASMLRAQGLTFEEAIKALQRATAAGGARPAGDEAGAARAPSPAQVTEPRPAVPPREAAPPPPPAPAPAPPRAAPVQPRLPGAPAQGAAAHAPSHANGAALQSMDEILAATRLRLDAARAAAQPSAAPAPPPQPSGPTPPVARDPLGHGGPELPQRANGADPNAVPRVQGRAAPAASESPRLEVPRQEPVAVPAPHLPEHAPPPRPAPAPPLQQGWAPPPGYPAQPSAPPPQGAPYPRLEPSAQPWRPPQPGPAGAPQPPPYGPRPGDPRPSTRPPWPEPPPPPDYAHDRRSDFAFDDNPAGAPYPNPDDLAAPPRPAYARRGAAPAGGQRQGAPVSAGGLAGGVSPPTDARGPREL